MVKNSGRQHHCCRNRTEERTQHFPQKHEKTNAERERGKNRGLETVGTRRDGCKEEWFRRTGKRIQTEEDNSRGAEISVSNRLLWRRERS